MARTAYDDALELSRKTLELGREFRVSLSVERPGTGAEVALRRRDRRVAEGVGTDGWVRSGARGLARALALGERRDEAEDVLRDIEHPSTAGYVDPYAIAVVYAGLGDFNRTFGWLEQAFEERATWLTLFVKCDPRFDALRSDRRFGDLLRRMAFAGDTDGLAKTAGRSG